MAQPAASPQAFTFGSLQLNGRIVRFNGTQPRRFVVHQFPKRRSARVEDMEGGPRRLEVDLVFTGDVCARDAQTVKAQLAENPRGLLTHPFAGQWQAFCEGPTDSVDFAQALDGITLRVAFIESELDGVVQVPDAPDVASAQQQASSTLSAAQVTAAKFMAGIAKASAFTASVAAQMNAAIAAAETVTAPIDFVKAEIDQLAGLGSAAIGAINRIAISMNALAGDVQNYVDAANDVFNGLDTTPAAVANAQKLLGTALAAAVDAQSAVDAAAKSPAGAADAHGAIEETIAACLVVDAAVRAARPPTVEVTVPGLTDLLHFCVGFMHDRQINTRDPLTFASEVMGLNRITNPAAIPSGTILLVPSR